MTSQMTSLRALVIFIVASVSGTAKLGGAWECSCTKDLKNFLLLATDLDLSVIRDKW